MNKLVKLFALTVMLIMGGQAMAQTRGAMFLGASFPVNDFAKFDGFSEFALTAYDEDDGGAGIGFNAGLKWYFNVGVKGLGVMLSLDGFYNGPNEDLKNAFRERETNYHGQFYEGSFKYTSTPKYINVPAMLGLNYIFNFNPNLGFYVEAGAGGNFRFITLMESVDRGNLVGIETQVKEAVDYDMAFGFAYQAGLGFVVAKNLVIGCSFYDLGGAAINCEKTVKTRTFNDNITNTDVTYPVYGTIHPMMILGRVGFSF